MTGDNARVELFGMPLDLLTMDETVERCAELAQSERPSQHVVVNAGKVVLARKDERLKRIINGCEIVNADGQSVVWAGRLAGYPVPERVAGIDLMERLLAVAEERGWGVYFLGATPDVLGAFLDVVRARYPRLTIAGSQDGYYTDEAAAADAIGASGARLAFLAMPSPKKEYFASAQLDRMGRALVVGVGGSFDVWAGVSKRAPEWMQKAGLEWFYRFIQEPGRMWKRYLVGNSIFIAMAVREAASHRLRGGR